MKINPLGLQSYQQLTARRQPSASQSEDARAVDNTLTISPQETSAQSNLAVKAPEGNYSSFLSPEENSALEMLFRRYADSGRFGSAYNRSADTRENEQPIGRVIDVKV
ncbi:MAG: hypothetical protein KOO62_11285 [candidate division Zixibacteria bacterium]|nr:hypothetical protein [candidate division Zixibacteria bacterium]